MGRHAYESKAIRHDPYASAQKSGMTQVSLAKKLNVSDKSVSKWETGLGYPEITLLPKLASVLGVTVDYLLTGERRGITLAGNLVVDLVKNVDCYPQMGMLANISAVSKAIGGCACNVAVDLAKIDPSVPLSSIGCVGDDDYGRYMIAQLQRYNIDTGCIRITDAAPTSFSDVISLPTGERTFFHARGANALLDPSDIDISGLSCSLFHIGYILLLDRFDQPDPEYGTAMARFLKQVQESGIKTSADVVSNSTGDYPSKIIPVLPRKVRLMNTGAILPAAIEPLPDYFNGKTGIAEHPYLHIRGIPADDLAQEPIVLELTW